MPPGVVTDTLAVPARPGGVTAVTVPESTTAKLLAGTPPMLTAVAFIRFAPLIITGVPPETGPTSGEIVVTTGAGTK